MVWLKQPANLSLKSTNLPCDDFRLAKSSRDRISRQKLLRRISRLDLHLTAIGIAAAIVVFTLVCDIMVTADVDGKNLC
jgi:hypothetical protein